MSLLLDALKKAAQDKQKASDLDKDGIQSPAKGEETAMEAEKTVETDAHTETELTLEGHVYQDIQPADDLEAEPKHPADVDIEDPEFTVDPPLELENDGATTSTVSDEALQLLIYKTNKEYRRSQKVLWAGLLLGSLILLIVGGFYYYNGMLEEVEALERKHSIAMRLVKEPSIDVHRPRQKPLVNEVIDTPAPVKKKVVQATQQPGAKKKATQIPKKSPEKRARTTDSVFSVKRTHKRDPVSDLLNNAYQSYTAENYDAASKAYREVLSREPLNRDAWMGEAAVAVKLGKLETARAAYSKLLKMDPRDEIATAGMANLDEAKPDTLSESRLKFMLQQQPDAAHVHFALGNFYARQKKWLEAETSYFKAWQGNSENADYAFNLAVSLDQIGKHTEAERFYRSSLELSEGQNIGFSVQAVNDRLNRTVQR